MTRTALLIGAQTNGLAGVNNDVAAMAQALEPRGFHIEQLMGPAASRAGILDAYERLITDARPDDACVIYFSGHGGLIPPPHDSRTWTRGARPDLQFIVPDDYNESSEGDFRGITGVELSVLLARLTAVTPNATVVLDCCHAAHMSRNPELRVKALLRPASVTYEGAQRHIDQLIGGGLDVHRRDPHSNPHAVRVVACAPWQAAWEGLNRDSVTMGLLTDALSRALIATQGLRVSWSTLIDKVRREIQQFSSMQRPEAEGPSSRQPFETTDVEALATLPIVVTEPDRITLLGAPLLGVEVGDEFAIMPSGAAGANDTPAIGTAMVDALAPMAALAELRLAPGQQRVPDDARAHRTRAAAPGLPVRVPASHPVTADLRRAMALRPLVRPAETDEEAAIEVAVDARGALVIRDGTGPLHTPYAPTPSGIGQIVANLQRLAQADALRRLGNLGAALGHRVAIEWGRVRDGREERIAVSGALVHAHPDERIYIRLRNDGDQTVYVSLIDIGISSRIAVLTAADPGGVRLAAGASYTYGWNEDRKRLVGVQVTWPEGIDEDFARPETVLAVISDHPVDVSVLQQTGVRDAAHLRGQLASGSSLERLLIQVATGVTRDLDVAERGVRYAVEPIDFMVSPTAPPNRERATFLIDDRPEPPVRLLAPRGAQAGKVAVRITDLVVPRHHALGGTDLRVDAVVLTAGAGDQPVYWAETMCVADVGDGKPHDLLIYHGSAADFLDVAVWVSRDASGSPALGELLAGQLTGASGQPIGPATEAAAAVAVLDAGAVLVNQAFEALSRVVEPSIGLFRTSLLAQERFGAGRHERRAQGFSFTFFVESVS